MAGSNYRGGKSNYRGRAGNAAPRGGAAPKAATIETERVYNVACKVGDEYIGIGIVDKFTDSGNLTMSLNKEAVDSLPVTDTGWINKVRLFEPKAK